ncbi:MAG TPA: menaquinone biosynthesis protein [Geobacteraceae bacterium]|nr:menaquinone biosynthesis protein [Geobacteraceae bacterium]
MLRIGEISYLNCTPIFSVLREKFDDSSYRFVPGTPAHLNGRLSSGEIDICPSSSIEYGRHPGSYLILPDLSISADGPVMSVLLFSRVPVEKLDGCSIALTSESATSVALLKILLSRMYGFRNSFTVVSTGVAEALASHDAVLLIGDTALRENMTDSGCRVYDLGELWRGFTGYPFVFALWLAREELAAEKGGELLLLHQRLLQAKRLSLENIERIAEVCAQNHWTNRDFLINYWRVLSYDLSPRHVDGLRLFFRYATECGVLEREPTIRMFA